MGCNDEGVANSREVVEGEQQANPRFPGPAVLDFDLAEVVFTQKEATSGRRGNGNNVAFSLRDQAGQRRIVPKDIVHLPFETSREPLTPAAQRCAFCTNVVKNSVGKGEKNVGGCVYFSTHEVMQSITKCNTFFGRLTHFREGLERDPSLAKALDRCIISDASNKLFWT